jgi:hypothetical protein
MAASLKEAFVSLIQSSLRPKGTFLSFLSGMNKEQVAGTQTLLDQLGVPVRAEMIKELASLTQEQGKGTLQAILELPEEKRKTLIETAMAVDGFSEKIQRALKAAGIAFDEKLLPWLKELDQKAAALAKRLKEAEEQKPVSLFGRLRALHDRVVEKVIA